MTSPCASNVRAPSFARKAVAASLWCLWAIAPLAPAAPPPGPAPAHPVCPSSTSGRAAQQVQAPAPGCPPGASAPEPPNVEANPTAPHHAPRAQSAESRRAENQRTFAGMLYPFARLSPQAQARAAQRPHLTPEQRAQCHTLDTHVPALEQQIRRSHGDEQASLQHTLQQARQMYRDLRC